MGYSSRLTDGTSPIKIQGENILVFVFPIITLEFNYYEYYLVSCNRVSES